MTDKELKDMDETTSMDTTAAASGAGGDAARRRVQAHLAV